MTHGYKVSSGDRLSWQQYQGANAHGGMLVETAEGGDTAWSTVDQNGNPINQDPVTGVWESRTVDLSSLANQHINLMAVGLDQATTGVGTIQYKDIALVSVDGTVQTIFNGTSVGLTAWWGNNSMATPQASFQTQASPTGYAGDTHFYLGDHLGTAQMEFASGGWPGLRN